MKSLRFIGVWFAFVLAILTIMQSKAQLRSVFQANESGQLSQATLPSNPQLSAADLSPQPDRGQSMPLRFFQGEVFRMAGFMTASSAGADLNGDGYEDVVVVNSCVARGAGCVTGNVQVFLDPFEQGSSVYDVGGYYPVSVAIGDLNGDGHPDLVVASQCLSQDNCTGGGEVSVLLGNGDGTFQPFVAYSSGGYLATSVAIGNVTTGGPPFLAVAHQCQDSTCASGGEVSVLLGNGDGTFQSPIVYSSGGQYALSIGAADLNGDGNADLVVANLCQSLTECSGGGVSVLLGNGDGTFQAPVSYSSGGSNAVFLALADFNHDGYPDVAVVNHNSDNVGVLLSNGDGTLRGPVTYYSGGYSPNSLAIGNLNGDSNPDIAVTNLCTRCWNHVSSVGILLGNGDGTFQYPVAFGSGAYNATSVTVSPAYHFPRPDLVVTHQCKTMRGCNALEGVIVVLRNKTFSFTKMAITSSINPSVVNRPVTFTATISSGSLPPDGSPVTFLDDSTEIGTGITTKGIATFNTSFSQAGHHRVEAFYSGDDFHGPSHDLVRQKVVP